MDITKASGEELAALLSQEYQKMLNCQGNLVALNQEINRRLDAKKSETEVVDAATRG